MLCKGAISGATGACITPSLSGSVITTYSSQEVSCERSECNSGQCQPVFYWSHLEASHTRTDTCTQRLRNVHAAPVKAIVSLLLKDNRQCICHCSVIVTDCDPWTHTDLHVTISNHTGHHTATVLGQPVEGRGSGPRRGEGVRATNLDC